MLGAGKADTFIQAPIGTHLGAAGATGSTPWVSDYVVAATSSGAPISVSISGFTIDAGGQIHQHDRYTGVLLSNVRGATAADAGLFDSEVKGFSGDDPSATGVRILGDSLLSVENNVVSHTINGIAAYGDLGAGNDPDVVIRDNTVNRNASEADGDEVGIVVAFGATGTVAHNTIGAGYMGVMISSSDYVTVDEGNQITGNVAGIKLYNASHATIEDNVISTSGWNAIDLENASKSTVRGNTISGAASNGIYLWASADNDLIENRVSGVTTGNGDGWGIALDGGSTDNELLRNTVTASDVGLWVGNGSDNAVVENNFLDGNLIAVQVGTYDGGAAPTGLAVRYNSLDSTLGLDNQTAVTVDASGNWWGDASGPGGVYSGGGAGVSDGVDFTPWLNSGTDLGADPTNGFQGDFSYLNVDDDSPQTGDVGRIQEAIDLVSGSTVYVKAGTYEEVVTIDKSVTLLGAKQGQDARSRDTLTGETIISPGFSDGDQGTFRVAADNVTIDGFEFANTTKAIHVVKEDGAANVVVRNNYVVNAAADGINFWRAASGTIEQNLIVGVGTSGITAGDDRGTASTGDDVATVAAIRDNEVVNARYGNTGYLVDSEIAGNVVRDYVGSDGAGIGGQFVGVTIGGFDEEHQIDPLKANVVSGYAFSVGLAFAPAANRPVSSDLTVVGNTVSGNGVGVLLMQDAAGLFTEFSGNAIDGSGLAAIAHAGADTWDLTAAVGNTIDGIATNDPDLADQFTLEDAILHKIDGPAFTAAPLSATGTAGLVLLVAENVYVTPGSYSPFMGTGAPSIQRGVNAAAENWTVNVASGTYRESNIVIDHALTIDGESQEDVKIVPAGEDGNLPSPTGGVVQYGLHIQSDNVTVQNVTLDGQGNLDLTPGKNNYRVGIYNPSRGNTHVDHVSVLNTYVYGINFESNSGASHEVTWSTIDNVVYKNAIRSRGTGDYSHNEIRNASGGIYVAWYTGSDPVTINYNTIENIAGTANSYYGPLDLGYAWIPEGIYHYHQNTDATVSVVGNTMSNFGDSARGLRLYNTDAASVVSGNTMHFETGGADNMGVFLAGSAGTTISDNHIYLDGADLGILVGRGVDGVPVPNVISGNTIISTGSTSTAFPEGVGIAISNRPDWDLTNVEIIYDTDTTITGNTITGLAYGVVIDSDPTTGFTNHATIDGDNEISGGGTGILVRGGGASATITDNSASIHGNAIGIDVDGGTAAVTGNHVYDNSTAGIRLQNGGSVTDLADNDFDDGAPGDGANDNATDLLLASSAGEVTLGAGNDFAGDTFFIDNQSGEGYDLAGTGNTFDETDDFRIEDKVHHLLDDDNTAAGLITWVDDTLFVTEGGTDHGIQRAINLTSGGWTINVEEGTYEERIVVDRALTLLGASSGVSKKGYEVPSGYDFDDETETIILEPTGSENASVVTISANDVTFDGFVVANLKAFETGGFNTAHLVYVLPAETITDLHIRNNVIGPNTNMGSQDGSKGRFGVYVSGHDYATKVNIEDNKVFDALGNGDGVFLWGPEDNEQYPPVVSAGNLEGSLISNNEITGNHRSGIEFAGKVHDVTISNNLITDNGGKNSADADNLKYGNGIALIRDGSDLSELAQSIEDITIIGNTITGNEKNGIYIGPKTKNIAITNNFIQNNGDLGDGYQPWDGIRVDLNESYYTGNPPSPGVRENPVDFITGIQISENHFGDGVLANGANAVNVIGTPSLGPIDASGNWWGSDNGPDTPLNTWAGTPKGGAVAGSVIVAPWLTDGTDHNSYTTPPDYLPVVAGFQPGDLDSTSPTVSDPDLADDSDSGYLDDDNITNVDTPEFTGKAEAGATVDLMEGDTVLGTIYADPSGDWSIISTHLVDGRHDLVARATDPSGNASVSGTLTVYVDTEAPVPDAGVDQDVYEGEETTLVGEFDDPIPCYSPYDELWHLESSTNGQSVDDASGDTLSFTPVDQGTYVFSYTVTDAAGNTAVDEVTVNAYNADPTIREMNVSSGNEGEELSFSAAATDPGDDTLTYTWDFGDGSSAVGDDVTHTYADDDADDQYTVTLTVTDEDDGIDTRQEAVTILNVEPTLDEPTPLQYVDEGSVFNMETMTFSDPGFTNVAAGTEETFTYDVDWGDGHWAMSLDVSGVTQGSEGVPTTGTIDASHVYADNGTYTVTVTVHDDDGFSPTRTFEVVVANVAPTLEIGGYSAASIAEGDTYARDFSFTDPEFVDVALSNTVSFTYSINWGDGTDPDEDAATIDAMGSEGVPTSGSFSGSHVYADDGTYTVTVTVTDDDGGSDVRTFEVTVTNVAPTLDEVDDQTIDEGAELSIEDIGVFTDPGFDNPLNTGGETEETFTYTINWDDGTPVDTDSPTIDVAGSPGVATEGSFDGSHVYADEGIYTVTVTVEDDDDGSDTITFEVTDGNVAPVVETLEVTTPVDEGQSATLSGTYSDAGTVDTHELDIDWDGDGDYDQTVTVTGGSFSVEHLYADDNPTGTSDTFNINVRLRDNDGDADTGSVSMTVDNVPPTPSILGAPATSPEGTLIELTSSIVDPGIYDTFEYIWQVTKDGVLYAEGSDPTFSFTPDDDAEYIVTMTVTDDDGGYDTVTATIEVTDVAPTIALLGNDETNEGAWYTLTLGAVTDPGADPIIEYVVLWGDGSSSNYTTAGAKQHYYDDNVYNGGTPVGPITVTLIEQAPGEDPVAHMGAGQLDLTVNNVAPDQSRCVVPLRHERLWFGPGRRQSDQGRGQADGRADPGIARVGRGHQHAELRQDGRRATGGRLCGQPREHPRRGS
ncbi:MAG: right-handed parallel beta-helix repeat-containing protein [Planctomycetia bacterium]|nr:right-handed parallel beta-helix repeat-containing protein [Planctomycetia bacterium]